MMMQKFILEHREEDVRKLALKAAHYPDIDLTYALQQIAGWQTARKKIPSWAAVDGIVYPPHLSMEQCSSEATARYKQQVAVGLLETNTTRTADSDTASCLVDLTGGLGVDFSFMARAFGNAVYVERQEHLCKAAQGNFKLLGLNHVSVVEEDAVEYLHKMDKVCMLFLDPARRNEHGGRTYAIDNCTPDILAIREELLEKAQWVMVKLSPMLDWHKAVADLGEPYVHQIHIVAVGNECKELLVVMSKQHVSDSPTVFCVNDEMVFSYGPSIKKEAYGAETNGTSCSTTLAQQATLTATLPQQYCFLYEPHAAIMKAGCFETLQQQFSVKAIGANSHLFVSTDFIEDFPGRKFKICAISSMNKKEIKAMLSGASHGVGKVTKANITVRNFPMSVDELRKRLKLTDGGDFYLFATSVNKHTHILLLCQKLSLSTP